MSYREEIIALGRLCNHLGVMAMNSDNNKYLPALASCSHLLALMEAIEEDEINAENE